MANDRIGRAGARLSGVLACLGACGVAAELSAPAHADLKVRSPIVDFREIEFEHNGLVTFDKRKSPLNGQQSYTFELGYGVTPWWFPELEFETEALPGEGNLHLNARTFENTFQLLPQGKYWLDLGFFAEYSNGVGGSVPSEITFGPILQKEAPGFAGATMLHTLNVFFTKEVGPARSERTGLFAAWQSRLQLNPRFEPGVEIYYSVEDIGRPGRLANQDLLTGPMVHGAYGLGRFGLPGAIKCTS
jgi:hypothetical protein